MKHLPVLVATASLALLAPVAVQAQDHPSSARPATRGGDRQIRGRVTSFDGRYRLEVRDENGYQDNVTLHDGTIINPTGLTPAPGMAVTILGYNAGSYFAANEIDTPYTFADGVPYDAGEPWVDDGPDISLGFFFGDRGRWHPYDRDFGRGEPYGGRGSSHPVGRSFGGGHGGGRGRR